MDHSPPVSLSSPPSPGHWQEGWTCPVCSLWQDSQLPPQYSPFSPAATWQDFPSQNWLLSSSKLWLHFPPPFSPLMLSRQTLQTEQTTFCSSLSKWKIKNKELLRFVHSWGHQTRGNLALKNVGTDHIFEEWRLWKMRQEHNTEGWKNSHRKTKTYTS